MANYCSIDEAKDIAGQPGSTAFIVQQWWLDDIDGLIERYTGQGYKGAERIYTHRGTGNETLRLPSKAIEITSITENGTLLSPSEYELDANGRLVERAVTSNMSWWYAPPALNGCWYKGYKYLVTYNEPDLDVLPSEYHFAAASCVAVVAMFAKKHKEFGVALTAMDAGSAGKVSTSASTSFPASLVEELRRSIKAAIPRVSV